MIRMLLALLLCANAWAEPGHTGAASISTTRIGPSGTLLIQAEGASDKISITTGNFGTISASRLYGNGSGITGIAVTPTWPISGTPAGVLNVASGTGSVSATSFAGNISGTYHYGQYASFTTVTTGSPIYVGNGTYYNDGLQAASNYTFIGGNALIFKPNGSETGYLTNSQATFETPVAINGNFTPSTALEVRGVISGTSLYGNSATLTGLLQAANVSVTGNVSANKFFGDGSGLTGITGGSSPTWGAISGIPSGVANISNSAGSVTVTSINATTGTFTNLAGALSTAAQPNVTSLGNLTGLTVNGIVTATGYISASTYYGDGSHLTGIAGGGGCSTFGCLTGVPAGLANISNSIGSVTVTSINATNLTGTIQTASQPNVTSLGTLTSLGMGGNISMGLNSISNAGPSTFTGLTVGGQVTATAIGATLISATAPAGTVTATYLYGKYVSATSGSAVTGGLVADTISSTAKVSATSAYIGNLTEALVSNTATTSTTALNTSIGGLFYLTLSSNTTVSLTNGAPGKAVQIFVKQDSTGGRTVNFISPTHHWNNQLSATLITSGSTVSQWSWTTPDGSNWFGGLIGSGM